MRGGAGLPGAGRARVGHEDRVGRLPRHLGDVASVRLGDDQEQRERRDREGLPTAEPERPALHEQVGGGQDPPDEQGCLEGQEEPDDGGIQEFGGQLGRRGHEGHVQGEEERRDDRQAEQRRAPVAAHDELAQAGDERAEQRGHVSRAPQRAAWWRGGLGRRRSGGLHGRPGRWVSRQHGGSLAGRARRPGLGRPVGYPRGRSLASGQAVRRLTLDQEIEGSNPSSPAICP